MLIAQLLVGGGLVLLFIGLARKFVGRPSLKNAREVAPLMKPSPGDWREAVYTPKRYRKPKP